MMLRRMQMKSFLLLGALAGVVVATGCSSLPPIHVPTAPDVDPMNTNSLVFSTRPAPVVDVLFVLDNSPSMAPKQRQLANVIASFVSKLDAAGANYHLGVTSTDIGAQTAPDTAFQPGNLNLPGCATYRGDDGELQRKSCRGRDQSKWSPDAKAACTTLCPTSLEPTGTDSFLWKQNGVTNAPGNDIVGTFRCMAPLGDIGCGLESPLEAAKRALDNHSTVNSGFLRTNSVLAVIFVTDEDDCSVAMNKRIENNPNSIDCTKNGMSTFNCWKNDFRCLAHNLKCNEPMTTTGPKTGCTENGNGYLEPIDKYVRFFSNLRPANKLVFAGIWSPTTLDNPDSNMTQPGKLVVDFDDQVCVPGAGVTCSTEALNRGRGSKAACLNTTDSNFFGQAQLRLSSFIRKFMASSRVEQSVCEPANYSAALDTVVSRTTMAAATPCLPKAPLIDRTGNPVCRVGLVDESTPYATPTVTLPLCANPCCAAWANAGSPVAPTAKPNPTDPIITTACAAEPDCYCVVPNGTSVLACKDSQGSDTALAGVWLSAGTHETPAGKLAQVLCETKP